MDRIRDFEYHGVKFHLNDNEGHNEYESEYRLLYYNEGFEAWLPLGTVDSIEDAKGLIDNYNGQI